jgi:acyl-[acyl-carrier-protein]-phospholipid O-acyltransferase/long-chain-fatty-acid--[acyl-carrier-protein] ligase
MLGWLVVVGAPLAVLACAFRRELARLFVIALLRLVYRLRAFGRENVPVQGGALLVPNHVSMIDGLWVGAVLPRLVYYLMHRDFVKTPVIGPFTAMMGTIPVSTGDTPEAKQESLRRAGARCAAGDLVCIFAEGVITRSGSLMPFMKGLETIATAGRVPIVPVALDRVWGSLFSFSGGRFLWKRPRRLPYPIDVAFGPQLPPDTPAWRVRDAVAELLAVRREAAAPELRPLGYRFVRSARKSARHPAVIGPEGGVVTHGALLADVLVLRSGWQRARAEHGGVPGARVATLVAPGRAGSLAHAVLALERDLALPLDATKSDAELVLHAHRTGAEALVAERAVLAARPELARAFGGRAHALEDLLAGTDAADRAFTRLLAALPGPALARVADPVEGATDALAAFPARDGVVVLSQANVVANVTALAQTFDFGPEERVLATAPLDDPLGHLAALWLPLVTGAAIVVPADLDGASLAAACRAGRVTVLPLSAAQAEELLARAEPGDLASVRLAFCDGSRAGAELQQRFQERFGKPLYAGWGLPELAPVATLSLFDIDSGKWHHAGSKPGAVGRALSNVALRIVGEHGELLPPGERGRLLVRGPGVFLGYLDDPATTQRRMRDGWLDTGRVASVDRDGFLYLEPPAA